MTKSQLHSQPLCSGKQAHQVRRAVPVMAAERSDAQRGAVAYRLALARNMARRLSWAASAAGTAA
jgi:hypothetical protein